MNPEERLFILIDEWNKLKSDSEYIKLLLTEAAPEEDDVILSNGASEGLSLANGLSEVFSQNSRLVLDGQTSRGLLVAPEVLAVLAKEIRFITNQIRLGINQMNPTLWNSGTSYNLITPGSVFPTNANPTLPLPLGNSEWKIVCGEGHPEQPLQEGIPLGELFGSIQYMVPPDESPVIDWREEALRQLPSGTKNG